MRGASTAEPHRFLVQRYFVWSKASKSRSGRVAAGQLVSAHGSNGTGAKLLSTREYGCMEREPPERRGPEHGCGMQQAREPVRGLNRREAENA